MARVSTQSAPATHNGKSGPQKPARLVYQYSVVPGGVQNPAELAEAIAHDPDVAKHYARLDLQNARLVRLRYSQKMYISYRRNGHILWTKTAHLIRAGENVITDGKVTARTRCGNRLASRPRGLTAPDEPSESQLDQPVAVAGEPLQPPVLLAQNSALVPPLAANGPVAPGPGGIPIWIGSPSGGGGIGGGGGSCETVAFEKSEHDTDKNENICKHHHPPPQVPEPGTWVLVGSGALFMVRRYWMDRLRSRTA